MKVFDKHGQTVLSTKTEYNFYSEGSTLSIEYQGTVNLENGNKFTSGDLLNHQVDTVSCIATSKVDDVTASYLCPKIFAIVAPGHENASVDIHLYDPDTLPIDSQDSWSGLLPICDASWVLDLSGHWTMTSITGCSKLTFDPSTDVDYGKKSLTVRFKYDHEYDDEATAEAEQVKMEENMQRHFTGARWWDYSVPDVSYVDNFAITPLDFVESNHGTAINYSLAFAAAILASLAF